MAPQVLLPLPANSLRRHKREMMKFGHRLPVSFAIKPGRARRHSVEQSFVVRARYAMENGRGLSVILHRMFFFFQETPEIIESEKGCWT